MSSPIYIPDKKVLQCASCILDCAIEVNSAAKYSPMFKEPRPTCSCPFGFHKKPINWIQ